MYRPSYVNLLLNVSEALKKALIPDVNKLAASSELRFQDALNGLTSVAAEPQEVWKCTVHQR